MLLPQDPDASARAIRAELETRSGRRLAVVIIDTLGRPFREGVLGMAIGVAGIQPLVDVRGQTDLFGYVMEHTVINRADEIAASASMVMGQAAEGLPVVIVRGARYVRGEGVCRSILREPARMCSGRRAMRIRANVKPDSFSNRERGTVCLAKR